MAQMCAKSYVTMMRMMLMMMFWMVIKWSLECMCSFGQNGIWPTSKRATECTKETLSLSLSRSFRIFIFPDLSWCAKLLMAWLGMTEAPTAIQFHSVVHATEYLSSTTKINKRKHQPNVSYSCESGTHIVGRHTFVSLCALTNLTCQTPKLI